MLQWVCHDRGLCAVVGLPLWSGSLVALVLIVVAVISFCSRLRCSQMLATHIHGARRREYPGLALLAQHGYRLCGANGREIKPQHLGALYDSMRRMCRRKFAAPAKPDGILHCQDDIEAFHPKIFDRCGGEHGGFL